MRVLLTHRVGDNRGYECATLLLMSTSAELNRFLQDVEHKAYRMALFALRDSEEALDVVQDAMFKLASRYGGKPAGQWRPLFYRILANRITDAHRQRSRTGRLFAAPEPRAEEDATESESDSLVDRVAAAENLEPELRSRLDGATERLSLLVGELPQRQREAFLLRAWEGFDVAATAKAMRCSVGSVKTHYSRAVHSLRAGLQEIW